MVPLKHFTSGRRGAADRFRDVLDVNGCPAMQSLG